MRDDSKDWSPVIALGIVFLIILMGVVFLL